MQPVLGQGHPWPFFCGNTLGLIKNQKVFTITIKQEKQPCEHMPRQQRFLPASRYPAI